MYLMYLMHKQNVTYTSVVHSKESQSFCKHHLCTFRSDQLMLALKSINSPLLHGAHQIHVGVRLLEEIGG